MTTKIARRVLVFGGSGVIGRSACRRALAAGCEVRAIARSGVAPAPVLSTLFSADAAQESADSWRPDAVIYAAGLASVGETEADPDGAYRASVVPLLDVLQGLGQAATPPRVVFVSSAAVYGEPETLPVPETARRSPISVYGRQRVECEEAVAAYARASRVSSIAARAFSLFGPEQKKLLVWELFRQLRDEPEVIIQGTGDETRDYLSIDAFCDRILALTLFSDPGFLAVNVAAGRGTEVSELARGLRSASRVDKPIRRLGKERPRDPKHWIADVTRLNALLKNVDAQVAAFDFDRELNALVEAWR